MCSIIATIKGYINKVVTLTDEEFCAFEDITSIRKLQKKELLIKQPEVCNKVIFTNKGYFRFFHYNSNGDEITSDFIFAPCFVTSYTSLVTGNPSFVNVQAMEQMEIAEMKKDDLYALYEQYPKIERIGRIIAEQIAINSEQHLFLLLNQTAEYRYRNLLQKYPQYIQSIPLQYIASYLGITQETLSRIRNSIK